MSDRLKNKVAIVTGAGSRGPGLGNGKATAILFARAGARVLCVDQVLERAEETVELIRGEGGEAAAFASLMEADDPINATGRVERRGSLLVVVVSEPSGLVRVGDLGQPIALAAVNAATADPASIEGTAGTRLQADLALPGGPPAAGLAALVALSVLSVGASLVRRRIVRLRAWGIARARIRGLGGHVDAA